MTAELVLEGIDERGRLIVAGDTRVLVKTGLGHYLKSEGKYLIDVSELAYLVFRDLVRVRDRDGSLDLGDLFSKYSRSKYDWIKFTVLLDLRSKGRRAVAGFGENDLIYDKTMVFVVEENSPLKSLKIVEWVEAALRMGYEPVIAIVDAHGDVTYYTLIPVRVDEVLEVVPK